MDPQYEATARRQEQRERTGAERQRSASICLVGLGYVGLPLALEFDRAGHQVTGYDLDEGKIDRLDHGIDTTGDLGDAAVAESSVTFSADPAAIGRAAYVIIAVPTPVNDHDAPDLGYVEEAGRTVGRWMGPGTTVILESTVYPGATREVLVPALETASGFEPGEEFFVGYSPERVTPGDPRHDLRSVVKVVSGQDEAVLDDVASLYESVVDAGVHRAPSIEIAEATKVVENVQRDVNIALVNEFAMAFERMDHDIDWVSVLESANTKWNFHDYRPGLVGGHCIPVDPHFFTYQSKRAGHLPRLTLAGREVNEAMPAHVAELTIKALTARGTPLRDCRVLLLGVTYKPGVADTRMSKVRDVVDRLREYGVEVVAMDPYVDDATIRQEFGVEPLTDESFDGFDGLVLATPHAEVRSLEFETVAATMNDDPVLIDVTAALDRERVVEAGFTYRSA